MKAVILAGGLGSRLSEETTTRPKPMVEIGGMPMLWHIMKLYGAAGINDFVICLGYKGYVIKEWFANYSLHTSDVTFDMRSGDMEVHRSTTEPWRVTLVDTGQSSMTGGRLRRVRPYVGDEPFCMTYGDGVSSVDIADTLTFHREHGRKATMVAVQPPGRFGALNLEPGSDVVSGFQEKPEGDGAWINGGFFVLAPSVFDYLAGDATIWEQEPLNSLASEGELCAYRYGGFWMAMDTLRERNTLDELWRSGAAPWKTW